MLPNPIADWVAKLLARLGLKPPPSNPPKHPVTRK